MSARRIRILLADDHTLVRAGIRALLENIEGAEVVGEADNGRDALALAHAHRPDLAVLDVSMKELNGIDAAAQIRADLPATRVLILSMHESEAVVRRAIRAGAAGYLVKDAIPVELDFAVRAVMKGEMYLSPRVARHVIGSDAESGVASSLEGLTGRQREVLQLIAEGRSTRDIALVLGVSHKTVEAHRAALMQRLAIFDVAGLALYAARHNLVQIDRAEE
ncbi:MAG TPA: response regulator transcription factor [Usitatibacter sp.]|nr:response regulator transcription factor [Usitatibacter sp.]